MSLLETALSIVAFLGFFAMVEYATYRVMEREHRKRDIYRLFFMLAWTGLAFAHMWVIAPFLNLPPTATVGLGVGLLFVFIAGGLGVPGLKTIADIGLYPFAQVYELFVVLLLLAEGVTLAVSFVTVSQLSFLSNIGPSSPQTQAALGLGIAASFVAVTFYNPRGENGYYYATGEYHQPSVDYEKFREIMDDGRAEHDDSTTRTTNSESSEVTTDVNSSEASRAPAKALRDTEYGYNWTRSDIGFDDIGGYYHDITFILESLTSKAFRIVGVFMAVLGGLFIYLYRRGIRDVNADFLSRLPAGMNADQVEPVALHPVEHLIFEIKFSALVAVLVTLPLILYYAWPALRERGLVTGDKRVLIVWGGSLFVGIGVGSAIGYSLVAPAVISWLAQDVLGANMIIAYRIKHYAWMIVYTTIGVGLLAEVPVSMFLFHFGGLISFNAMRRRWREVTIAIFALAMFFTPSGLFTMLFMGIPVALAFYFGLAVLWVATLGGRRGGGGTTVEEPA